MMTDASENPPEKPSEPPSEATPEIATESENESKKFSQESHTQAEKDFFDQEPSLFDKSEMRKTLKSPSEWLHLLCKEWAKENSAIVDQVDEKFFEYKSYLKGKISPQLLCRLSDPILRASDKNTVDFWAILGITDEFDKSYVTSQVEKFCTLFNVRGTLVEEEYSTPALTTNGISNGYAVAPGNGLSGKRMQLNFGVFPGFARGGKMGIRNERKNKKDRNVTTEAERNALKREQQRLMNERRDLKNREREANNIRKAAEKAARDATKEERRRKKVEMRDRRERMCEVRKNQALQRAAELVQSNRVPLEITQGAKAATAAANAAAAAIGISVNQFQSPAKKARSSIVVSTAADLDQIVCHSKNLWTKYNAIAKQHNQKVNWITVAKELGIHVKVREKYARMHARALQRGFDFKNCGHFKIKDYPEVFLEPIPMDDSEKLHEDKIAASQTHVICEPKSRFDQQMNTQQQQHDHNAKHQQVQQVQQQVQQVQQQVQHDVQQHHKPQQHQQIQQQQLQQQQQQQHYQIQQQQEQHYQLQSSQTQLQMQQQQEHQSQHQQQEQPHEQDHEQQLQRLQQQQQQLQQQQQQLLQQQQQHQQLMLQQQQQKQQEQHHHQQQQILQQMLQQEQQNLTQQQQYQLQLGLQQQQQQEQAQLQQEEMKQDQVYEQHQQQQLHKDDHAEKMISESTVFYPQWNNI